jgi:hypothetical protein
MKNIKIEKKLVGDKFWFKVAYVNVEGSKGAKPYTDKGSEEAIEGIVQSWEDIAVLKVTPKVPFKFGYVHGRIINYLKSNIETDDEGRFGVHIGDDKVTFFVIPTAFDMVLTLELVARVKLDDSNYKNLPLY